MKRIMGVCLVLLLICLFLSSSADPAPEDAEALRASAKTLGEDPDTFRSFIQNRYDILIRMGDECGDCTIPDCELRIVPEAATPFLRMAAGNRRFAEMLIRLNDAVAAFPPGFFARFPSGLRFWLADEVSVNDRRAAGFFANTNGTSEIALSRRDSDAGSPYHEIWHAMESTLLAHDPDALTGWDLLNPEGFAYTGDFSVMGTAEAHQEPEDWFASEYAKVNGAEDRAMTFRALMTRDEAWWESRPHLRKKAEFLLKKAEPVFGKIQE